MNAKNEAPDRTSKIHELGALLNAIDCAQTDEQMDGNPIDRGTRLTLLEMAERTFAEIAAELRAAVTAPEQASYLSAD